MSATISQVRLQANRLYEAPLSFAQERLWFLNHLAPNSAVYNIGRALHIRGTLNAEALEESLNEIVVRHEILRTCFPTTEGKPRQVIASSLRVPLPRVDLGGLFADSVPQAVQQCAVKLASQPFDLQQLPLLRAQLLLVSKQEHVLLLSMHHIVADGWSLAVLLRELGTLYEARVRGGRAHLPELALQYADFAQWQRERMQGEMLQEQLEYWRKQLQGSGALELPSDHSRSSVPSFAGGRVGWQFSPQLSAELRALARREDVTLFMVLLGVFQVLLGRYSGQRDLVVGTPVANRNQPEIEPLIGFFVNTLVMRMEWEGGMSFRQLVRGVREMALGAYAHQEVPFEKLVEELQPERSLSHSPLFQVMFALQNTPELKLEFGGLQLQAMEIETGMAKYDVTVSLRERKEGLFAWMEYSRELYEEETIRRMGGHYQRLLEEVVRDAGRAIGRLPLLSEEEEQQLREWNGTEVEYGGEGVVELFERQAEEGSAAIAVVCGKEEVSYGELNRRANQLAHYLREQGVGAEKAVGICLRRSVEMVVGMLGILKAGGAYVPLDAGYPRERLGYMVEDCGAEVVVTERELKGIWGADRGVRCVCVDDEREEIGKRGEGNVEDGGREGGGIVGENLAYIIYTSGSTGRPKGVMIQHASLANAVLSFGDDLNFRPEDVLLAVTPISFDIAALELFLPLVSGAMLVVAEGPEASAPEKLSSLLDSLRVTTMQATPVTWRILLSSGWHGKKDLNVLCGGESLIPSLAMELVAKVASVWNVYGPTETTIWSSSHYIHAVSHSVPVGRPIANTQLHVLDSHLQPVPVNVVGDLYIGGYGLARGYIGRPELTAEKFVPDPFSPQPGARLYRTGDLARWHSDGNLDFVGRQDHQVKIRGFRIELGEVEAALAQCAAVEQAVVVVQEDTRGDKRLVAYVAGRELARESGAELRRSLQQKLPEYMIPGAIVVVERLPLTPNGKIDRKALPRVEGGVVSEAEYVGPRTENEELLAGIWAKVLGLERIGIYDNFFELGGDSVLSVQIVAQALRAGLPLTVQDIFRNQTVAQLAGACTHQTDSHKLGDKTTPDSISIRLDAEKLSRMFSEAV